MNATASRSRIVRHARRAAALGTLGLITTIAVAWLFAALPLPDDSTAYHVVQHSRPITATEDRGYLGLTRSSLTGWTWYSGWYSERLLLGTPSPNPGIPRQSTASAEDAAPRSLRRLLFPWKGQPDVGPGPSPLRSRHVIAVGLPCRALYCARALDRTGPSTLAGTPLPARLAPRFERTTLIGVALLPTHPLWLGLLADTALYAAAWAALFFGAAAARCGLRRRRGRCPRCAYDLRGLGAGSPCPECGGSSRHTAPVTTL